MTFENQMSTFNSFSGHGVEKIFSPPGYVGSRTKVVRKTLYIRGDPLPLSAIELFEFHIEKQRVSDTFYIQRYITHSFIIKYLAISSTCFVDRLRRQMTSVFFQPSSFAFCNFPLYFLSLVRWPTTVTSKPNAHIKFKSLTSNSNCSHQIQIAHSKFKSLTANYKSLTANYKSPTANSNRSQQIKVAHSKFK